MSQGPQNCVLHGAGPRSRCEYTVLLSLYQYGRVSPAQCGYPHRFSTDSLHNSGGSCEDAPIQCREHVPISFTAYKKPESINNAKFLASMEKFRNLLDLSKEELDKFFDGIKEDKEFHDLEKLADESQTSYKFHVRYYKDLVEQIQFKVSFMMATVSLLTLSFVTIFLKIMHLSESRFFLIYLLIGFIVITLLIITLKGRAIPRVTLITFHLPSDKKNFVRDKINETIFLKHALVSWEGLYSSSLKYYYWAWIFFYPFCFIFFISIIMHLYANILEFDCELAILSLLTILVSVIFHKYRFSKVPPNISY